MHKTLRSPDHARLVALLVAARAAADLTQQELAKKLNRHQSFIAKYENGERRLDVVELIAIARALGVDPQRLFRDFVAGKGAPGKPRGRSA
jgi:transcriptional regulator with XRE-family HTH domain